MPEITKPTDKPEWATGGSAAVITPPVLKQQTGWIVETMPHQFQNWLQKGTFEWIEYLENQSDLDLGASAREVLTPGGVNADITPTTTKVFVTAGLAQIVNDNLDEGRILAISPNPGGGSITIAHAGNNIFCYDGENLVLAEGETAFFERRGTNWYEIATPTRLQRDPNPKADTITEKTLNSGVTIESVLLKDGNVSATDGTFTGSMTIQGNLDVQGTTTTIDTENLQIEDNIILLNRNEAGSGVGGGTGTAGIEIERGSLTNVQLHFDESDDKWKAGQSGAYKKLALYSLIGDPASGDVLFSDGSDLRAASSTANRVFNFDVGTGEFEIGNTDSAGTVGYTADIYLPILRVKYPHGSQLYWFEMGHSSNRYPHLAFNATAEGLTTGNVWKKSIASAVGGVYIFGGFDNAVDTALFEIHKLKNNDLLEQGVDGETRIFAVERNGELVSGRYDSNGISCNHYLRSSATTIVNIDADAKDGVSGAAYLAFRLGSVRKGYIGKGSSSSDDIYLYSDSGSLILRGGSGNEIISKLGSTDCFFIAQSGSNVIGPNNDVTRTHFVNWNHTGVRTDYSNQNDLYNGYSGGLLIQGRYPAVYLSGSSVYANADWRIGVGSDKELHFDYASAQRSGGLVVGISFTQTGGMTTKGNIIVGNIAYNYVKNAANGSQNSLNASDYSSGLYLVSIHNSANSRATYIVSIIQNTSITIDATLMAVAVTTSGSGSSVVQFFTNLGATSSNSMHLLKLTDR